MWTLMRSSVFALGLLLAAPPALADEEAPADTPPPPPPPKKKKAAPDRRGCCQGHGGVCGCNKGYWQCCDGSYSKNTRACRCRG
jgi:hypothetical protein